MENTNPTAPEGAQGAGPTASEAESAVLADVERLGQELGKAEAMIAELRDTLLRERAEIENQRRRLQRDLEQARRYANDRLLGDLLPVCDSLERGLAVENADVATLREGMDLTLKALVKVAEASGLMAIDPSGQAFDPALHQAMSMVENTGQPSGTVIATFQKGYVLNDRLLRPALVSVAK